MGYKNIPFGTPRKFNVIVENLKDSKMKYEYDEALDAMKLDWVFTEGYSFPFDYGFIPETRGGDGDMLDVFVLGSRSAAIGTIVECRALGMIELIDRGEQDDKVIAVPLVDPACEAYRSLDDLPFDYKIIFEESFRALGIQKKKTVEIKGYKGAEGVLKELAAAHAAFSGYADPINMRAGSKHQVPSSK